MNKEIKVFTAAEQLAAKRAAFEAAQAEFEAAQEELGLLATKEVICNAVNDCINMDAICTALFDAIKENFPAKVSTFATLQEVFPVLMNVTVKKSGSKNTTVTAKNGNGKTADAVYKLIDEAPQGLTKDEICTTGNLNANTVGRLLRPVELRAGYEHRDGKYFKIVSPK